jgi:hypothetical protein
VGLGIVALAVLEAGALWEFVGDAGEIAGAGASWRAGWGCSFT